MKARFQDSPSENLLSELMTIRQFSEKFPAFSQGNLRWLIFQSPLNGLEASGCLIRVGRRILISPSRFWSWLESRQPKRYR